MITHEENPVKISRIRTQIQDTTDGMQWAETFRVRWTDPASGSTIVRLVGDRRAALRLKRQIQGVN